MPRILVIGNGFLGSHVHEVLKSNGVKSFVTHFQLKSNKSIFLNVLDEKSIIDCFEEINPTVVINCAAITDLDNIEKKPHEAFLVNAEAVKNIAKITNKMDARFIQISTDSVFDGISGMYTETDSPNPMNEYAKSKILGEQYAQKYCKNHIVIRTNFYGYDKDRKNLFSWILSNLKNNKTIIGFDDVVFNPLEISNLSKMIMEISLTNHTGLFHFSSDESFSKYQFALRICKYLGKNNDLIKKGSIKDINLVAKRPLNTTLSNKKSKKILKTSIISFDDGLKTCIKNGN